MELLQLPTWVLRRQNFEFLDFTTLNSYAWQFWVPRSLNFKFLDLTILSSYTYNYEFWNFPISPRLGNFKSFIAPTIFKLLALKLQMQNLNFTQPQLLWNKRLFYSQNYFYGLWVVSMSKLVSMPRCCHFKHGHRDTIVSWRWCLWEMATETMWRGDYLEPTKIVSCTVSNISCFTTTATLIILKILLCICLGICVLNFKIDYLKISTINNGWVLKFKFKSILNCKYC